MTPPTTTTMTMRAMTSARTIAIIPALTAVAAAAYTPARDRLAARVPRESAERLVVWRERHPRRPDGGALWIPRRARPRRHGLRLHDAAAGRRLRRCVAHPRHRERALRQAGPRRRRAGRARRRGVA